MRTILCVLVMITITAVTGSAEPPAKLTAHIDWPVDFLLTGKPGHVGFFATPSGGVPPYTYKWDFGDKRKPVTFEDPGIVILSESGTHEVIFHVTDSKNNTAFDTVQICIDGDMPKIMVRSPLPGQVTGDLKNHPIKGRIEISKDAGVKFLQTKGISLKDIPFSVTAAVTLENPKKQYFTPLKLLTMLNKENNSFEIGIKENITIPEGDTSFKIEAIGIDPAGNGLTFFFLNSIVEKIHNEKLISIMNTPTDPRIGIKPYYIMGFINSEYPLIGLPWLIKNYKSLNIHGRMNLIRSLRFCDSEEAYLLLMMFVHDRTPVPGGKTAELMGERYIDLRICDHVYNALHFLIFTSRKRSHAPRFSPFSTVNQRDKMIEAMLKNWEESKDFFLAEKKLASTKNVNLLEMIDELRKKLDNK